MVATMRESNSVGYPEGAKKNKNQGPSALRPGRVGPPGSQPRRASRQKGPNRELECFYCGKSGHFK